jgi:hypothetical protein
MTGLPAEITFGKVVGRWILAVADTAADPDRLPEAKAPSGEVKFTRLDVNTSLLDTTQNDGTYVGVARQHVSTILDDTGELCLSHDTDPGVWLITGWYKVEAKVANVPWPTFNIEVTTEHTDQNPLDLIAWTPVAPPIGGNLTVVQVPADVPDGYLLAKNGTSFTGIDPATLAAPVTSVNAQTGAVVLGAADVGADPAGTAAGLVGALVIPDSPDDIGAASAAHTHAPEDVTGTAVITTDARLSDARPPLAHLHTLADVTDAGDAAGLDVGTTAGTVMAGDDSRVTSLSSTYVAPTGTDGRLQVNGVVRGARAGRGPKPPAGSDDKYVTDAEKLALHSHTNKDPPRRRERHELTGTRTLSRGGHPAPRRRRSPASRP